jgi:prepilin-type processing-associated H-X9-DG protein
MKRANIRTLLAAALGALILAGGGARRCAAQDSLPPEMSDLLRRLPENVRGIITVDTAKENPNMQYAYPQPPDDPARRQSWEALERMRKDVQEGLSRILLLFGLNANLGERLPAALGPQFVAGVTPGSKGGPPRLLFLAGVKDRAEAEARIGRVIGSLARNATESVETVGDGRVHTWRGFPFTERMGKKNFSISYLVGEHIVAVSTNLDLLKEVAAPSPGELPAWVAPLASAHPRSLLSFYVSPKVTDLLPKGAPNLEEMGFDGRVSSLTLSEDGLTLSKTMLLSPNGPISMVVSGASQVPELTDQAFRRFPKDTLAALAVSSPAGWLKALGGVGLLGALGGPNDPSNPVAPMIKLFSTVLDGDVAVGLRSLLPLPSALVTVAGANADAARNKLNMIQEFARQVKMPMTSATGRDGEPLTAFQIGAGPYKSVFIGSQGSYLVGSTDLQTMLESHRLDENAGDSLAESEIFRAVRRNLGDHPRLLLFADGRALSGAGMIASHAFFLGNPIGMELARTFDTIKGVGLSVDFQPGRVDSRTFFSGDPSRVLPVLTQVAMGAGVAAASIGFQALMQAREKARQSECLSIALHLASAAMMYAQDWDEHLPKADAWQTQLRPYVKSESILHCPSDGRPGPSYAMNTKLSRLSLSRISNPAETVLFYESDLHGSSPHGVNASQAMRHNGGMVVAYADGHVKVVYGGLSLDDFRAVRAAPPKTRPGVSKPPRALPRAKRPPRRKSPSRTRKTSPARKRGGAANR